MGRQSGACVGNVESDFLIVGSGIAALRAAIEGRASLASAPGLTPRDMRFGLHVADVMTIGDDLRGDGVNIAARLQSTADPGEIDVSGVLYDHVRRAAPCGFEMLGEAQRDLTAEQAADRLRNLSEKHYKREHQ